MGTCINSILENIRNFFAVHLFGNTIDKFESELDELTKQLQQVVNEKNNLTTQLQQKEEQFQLKNDEFHKVFVQLKKAENRSREAEMQVLEMFEKMRVYEKQINNLQIRNGDLPSADIDIGAYEMGGVNPSIIEERWRAMYVNLHQTFLQASKELKLGIDDRGDSHAAKCYRSLVYDDFFRGKVTPRLQAYAIIRQVSTILFRICPSAIVDANGTIIAHDGVDLVGDLMRESQSSLHSRRQFAEYLLSKMIDPKDFTLELTQPFDKLPDTMKRFLYDHNASCFEYVKALVGEYLIFGDLVNRSLAKFIYTAIYVTIEMSVISDNSIMAYWSSCIADWWLFEAQQNTGFIRIPFKDSLYLDLEVVSYPPDSKTPIPLSPDDPSQFILFTAFPGCVHFSNGNGHMNISTCRVICGEVDRIV